MTRGDAAASAIVSFIIAAGLVTATVGVLVFIPSLLPARSAASSASASLHTSATSALKLLAQTRGEPEDWCATHTSPTRYGMALTNASLMIDPCKLRALRSGQNTPAGLDTLRRGLGLDSKNGHRSFHLRIEPLGGADATQRVAPLANMSVVYVRANPPTSASAVEEHALAGLGLNYTAADIDTIGGLAAGDDAPMTRATLTHFLAPRLFGFTAAQDDGPTPGASDSTYWKILNATRAIEDAGGTSSASVFGPNPPYRHVATVGHFDPSDGHWVIDTVTPRTFRLIALLNLSSLPFGHFSATLDFRYAFDPGTTLNKAQIEICAWPCTLGASWNLVADLAATHPATTTESDYAAMSVALARSFFSNGGRAYVSFTYSTLSAQDSGTAGFFFTDPHVRYFSEVVVPDWVDANTNRTLGALLLGTDAAQAELDDAYLDRALEDYAQDGGEILALGSANADDTWLRYAAQGTSVATANAPLRLDGDSTHPLLNEPSRLHPELLTKAPRALTAVAGWESVLYGTVPGTSGAPLPLLQASFPSSTFNGTIILTAYALGSSPVSSDEVAHALGDWLLAGRLRSAYVDYGDTIPRTTTGVAQDTRTMTLTLDDATNEATTGIRVRLTLYSW